MDANDQEVQQLREIALCGYRNELANFQLGELFNIIGLVGKEAVTQ